MKVDFFASGSADILTFERIYPYIDDPCIIYIPVTRWGIDISRTIKYLKDHNLSYRTVPRTNPDCVIVTQAHKIIEFPYYRHSLSMRIMYGMAEKGTNHQKKFNRGFDAILVSGKYSAKIIGKFMPTIIGGFPKFDLYFRGVYNKKELIKKFNLDSTKKTVLYIPTWGVHSSIEQYHGVIKELVNSQKYNFIFKPHTVTVGSEKERRERIGLFKDEIEKGRMICLLDQIGLDILFSIADIVIADVVSGAVWESILIAQLPTLAINKTGNFKRENLEAEVENYTVVNDNPATFIEDLEDVEEKTKKYKRKWEKKASEIFAYRDGYAGKHTAIEIKKFVDQNKKPLSISDRVYDKIISVTPPKIVFLRQYIKRYTLKIIIPIWRRYRAFRNAM